MAADVAMTDMDIDFSMEAEVDPEIARLQAEADAINARAEVYNPDAMNGVEEVAEEGEVDVNAAAPKKVHVRGLDNLNTLDIKRWAGEYDSLDLLKRVEWVDDSSANLVYDTEIAATEALNALSAEEATEPLQLRQAKHLPTHPNSQLAVRQAIEADVKAPGAKDRSRYYLFNPEWDPDNPENIRNRGRKRRAEDDGGQRKYRRRDYEDDRHHRRDSAEKGQFHEDMYGDEPSGADARRNSVSSASDHGRRQIKYDDEDLFASKSKGRLRDRSASPVRDGDGRFGFAEEQPRRRTARPRSRTPERIRAGRDNRGARDNLRKELFPDKKSSTSLTNGHHANGASVSSVPSRPSTAGSSRELFPDRVNGHRRRIAKDIHPDEVANAIGHRPDHPSRSREPPHTKASEASGGGKDLFSRINGGPTSGNGSGRLTEDNSDDRGFSFKGKADGGFSFLGASRERAENPLVKELFPLKAGGGGSGGGGKDLFDGRIKGRGSRRRAEDLF